MLDERVEKKLKSYFLGELSEEEEIQVESEFLFNDEKYEQFQLYQDDLIKDYILNHLSATEKKLFKEHFLQTNEKQERFLFINSLISQTAINHFTKKEPTTSSTQLHKHQNQSKVPSEKHFTSFLLPIAASIIVLTTIITIYMAQNNANLLQKMNSLQEEQSKQNSAKEDNIRQLQEELIKERTQNTELLQQLQKQQSIKKLETIQKKSLEKSNDPYLISLNNSSVRSNSSTQKFSFPLQTSFVKFLVPIDKEINEKSYQIVLYDGNLSPIYSKNKLQVTKGKSKNKLITFIMSATLLKPSEYILKVFSNNDENNSLIDYAFTIQ